VRNLISQQDGVKAAFFGFQDRFRALPGDYLQATVNIANVSVAACNAGNGDGNGRIIPGVLAGPPPSANEDILAWEHLSRAGFLAGTFVCAAAASGTTSPTNPYTVPIQLAWDNVYGAAGAAVPAVARHNVKTGNQIPVDLIAEIDRKIDDGFPYTGTFQFSLYAIANPPVEVAAGGCIVAGVAPVPSTWNIAGGAVNCGAASVY
jgi:hypothetical protein